MSKLSALLATYLADVFGGPHGTDAEADAAKHFMHGYQLGAQHGRASLVEEASHKAFTAQQMLNKEARVLRVVGMDILEKLANGKGTK
jgi:hypothetical protein